VTGGREESPAAFRLPVAMASKNSGLKVGTMEMEFYD
jgi:hypothetical protein